MFSYVFMFSTVLVVQLLTELRVPLIGSGPSPSSTLETGKAVYKLIFFDI